MPQIVAVILATLGIVFVIISGILLSMFPSLLSALIRKQLVLSQGSDLFLEWTSASKVAAFKSKFYLFDVQNPEEVQVNGTTLQPLVLKERGPYTFEQRIRREVLGFESSNQLISYKDVKTYHFLREESVSDLSDEVTVVNIPVVAAIDGAVREAAANADLGEVVTDVVASIIRDLGETLFEVRTVDQMLFSGFRVPLLDRMAEVGKEFGLESSESSSSLLPNNTFGLMVGKNDSDSGILTIWTGADGSHVFAVHSWDMSRTLSFWNGSFCNQINGSDGSFGFGPGITRNSVLYAFQADFCRSAELAFDSDSEVKGIKTLRFILPTDPNFQASLPSSSSSSSSEDGSSCFCTQREPRMRDVCSIDGLLDVSTCSEGAPIALSPPHFLGGDPQLKDPSTVLGLDPSTDRHQMFLDIEPMTGTILAAAKRLQINVVLRNHPNFEIVSGIKETLIVPVLWMEETAEVSEESISGLKRSLFSKIVLVKTILKSFLVVGLIVIFIAVVIVTIFHTKKQTRLGPGLANNHQSNQKQGSSSSHLPAMNRKKGTFGGRFRK